MTIICFDRHSKEFGGFSNFAPYPIDVDGKTWPTVEHYYQACKFLDDGYQELIRLARTPAEAKKMGRSRSHPIRPDWDEIKEEVMAEALHAKFTQHNDLKKQLLATGNDQIVEHSAYDSYWGDGGDGRGFNRLGELLMQLRIELKSFIEIKTESSDF